MRHNDIKRLYITLGVESADTPIDPALDVQTEDTISAEAIESVDEAAELDSDVKQLENFTDVTEGVGDLDVAIEAALASGRGLTRIEATSLNLALKATMGKYVPVENNIVPGRESYDVSTHVNKPGTGGGDNSNNTEQTQAAKKGIKESIKAFIAAIIKKIKSIIQAAKGLFKRIYDRIYLLRGKLAKLAQSLKDSEYFGSMKVKYNIVNVHIDGKFEVDAFADALMNAQLIFRQLATGDDRRSKEEEKFLDDGVKAIKESDGELWDKLRVTLRGFMATDFSKLCEGKVSKREDGKVASESLPGGKRLVFSPGQDTGMMQLPTIVFQRVDKLEGDPTVEINLPDRDALNGLLSASIGIIQVYQMTRDYTSHFEKTYSKVIKELGGNRDLKQEAKVEGDKERLGSISNFMAAATGFRTKFLVYGVDMLSSVVQMTEIALTAHAAEKTKKADEEAKAGKEKTA